MIRPRLLRGLVLAVLFLLWSREAMADDASSTAQALFDQGVAEMKAKDYASACRKFEEVTRILPDALGAKVELAACYEKEGRLASAWAEWSRVQAQATRSGQRDRAARASERVHALEPRLSRLTVRLMPEDSALAGIVVRRDGAQLGAPQWGVPLPIDGGDHEIEVTAPGRAAFRMKRTVAGEGENAVVEVPVLAKEGEASALAQATTTTTTTETSPSPARPGTSPWRKPLSRGLVGVGAAATVTGIVLGSVAIANYSRSNDESHGCSEITNVCSSESGVAVRKTAVEFATGSTVAFVVGGVAAAAGIVLWVTEPATTTGGLRAKIGASNVVLEGAF